MNLPQEVLALARSEGIDPFAALYRFEKSKHIPARYETSKRHPIVNLRRLLVDARVRNLTFDKREDW